MEWGLRIFERCVMVFCILYICFRFSIWLPEFIVGRRVVELMTIFGHVYSYPVFVWHRPGTVAFFVYRTALAGRSSCCHIYGQNGTTWWQAVSGGGGRKCGRKQYRAQSKPTAGKGRARRTSNKATGVSP